jgi:hypothetical protein
VTPEIVMEEFNELNNYNNKRNWNNPAAVPTIQLTAVVRDQSKTNLTSTATLHLTPNVLLVRVLAP